MWTCIDPYNSSTWPCQLKVTYTCSYFLGAKGVFINTLVGGLGKNFFRRQNFFDPPLTRWKTFSTPPLHRRKNFFDPPITGNWLVSTIPTKLTLLLVLTKVLTENFKKLKYVPFWTFLLKILLNLLARFGPESPLFFNAFHRKNPPFYAMITERQCG